MFRNISKIKVFIAENNVFHIEKVIICRLLLVENSYPDSNDFQKEKM